MTKQVAVAVACAAAVALGTVSVAAQAPPAPRGRGVGTSTGTPFSTQPYSRIFDPRSAPLLRSEPPAPPAPPLWRVSPRPDILPERRCSLIVVKPDLRIDPQFEKWPREAQGRYPMPIAPAVCR